MNKPKIIAAAIRLTDGRVFSAPTHAQAYWLAEDAGISASEREAAEYGYVDTVGAWVAYTEPHLAGGPQG